MNKKNLIISLAALSFIVLPNSAKAAPANPAFKDDNFYSCVLSKAGLSEGTNITTEQLGAITELDCKSKSINDTSGLELMTSLTDLNLSNNEITSIDISKNTALTRLDLSINKLTSIDLSKNSELIYLNLESNQLASIDLSHNTLLEKLNLRSNKLTSIDISKNLVLGGVTGYAYLENNQLTCVDNRANTQLRYDEEIPYANGLKVDEGVTVGSECKVTTETTNKTEETNKTEVSNKVETTNKIEETNNIVTEETTTEKNPKTGLFKAVYLIPVGLLTTCAYLVLRRKKFLLK